MIITLCRRGLLKIYASFCELNISFCKTLTFRFADYTFFILLSVVVLSFQLLYFRFSCRIFFLLLCFWLQLLCHVESSLAAITHGEDNSSTTAHNVTAGIDGRL